jgi:metal-responsive CopG/Arc/MetJ family transcriptional regulator
MPRKGWKSVSLPTCFIEEIDKYIKKGLFKSRSKFFQTAAKQYLSSEDSEINEHS